MTVNPAAPSPHPVQARTARMPRSARRTQLLRAAREVFVAQGYHAAAMDDIAERAGVSKPVLYQHFPGKLDLYLALMETHADELVQRIRDAMSRTSDNTVRVHNAVCAYFDFVDAEGEAFRLVFESDLRNEPTVRTLVEAMSDKINDAITDTIAADTGLTPERARLLSVGLTGMSEITARWWLNNERLIPKEDAINLVESLAWGGISNFPLLEH